MSWFTPKLARGESILFRRGAFVSMIGLAAVVIIFATGFAASTGGVRWPVTEMAVMGMALAALPVAFFAAGVRMGLEPGETMPIRPRNQDYWVARLFGLLAIPFLSLSIGFVTWHILFDVASGLVSSEIELNGLRISAAWVVIVGAGLGTFLIFRFVWQKTLNQLDLLFLTNRRVFRFKPGFWFGRIEVLALGDVAEIRGSPLGITLVATSRDAMRRLRRDGSTEPADIDRLDIPLSKFGSPDAPARRHDRTLYGRVVKLLGREPLRWNAPALPRDVERLVSLGSKLPNIVLALAAIPMLATGIAVFYHFEAQGVPFDAMMLAVLTSILVPLGLAAAGCYLFLWLAARKLTPENTALFLRATLHPDWGPGRWPRAPYIAARRAALKRRERISSWLAGRPVPFEDAPGPEAFGGGWRA